MQRKPLITCGGFIYEFTFLLWAVGSREEQTAVSGNHGTFPEGAKEEFPDFQVEERSAVSIARRLQDPLAELVKIEPKAISVGQYQHDMNQKKLEEQLDYVVMKTVNRVGVNVNTASPSLLKYVSGITKRYIEKKYSGCPKLSLYEVYQQNEQRILTNPDNI